MNCRWWFWRACHKEKHQYIQYMKDLNHSFGPRTLTAMVGSFAAALALLGTVTPTLADDSERQNSGPRYGDERRDNQMEEIHLLLTAVHEVTSYNGDAGTRSQHLAAWEQLWAEDATFVINGTTTFTGRNAIMNFFAGAPFFNNRWIGLTPSFRTEIAIHGHTAEVYLECIFLNESKTVVAERALSGALKKVDGNWLFWHMKNDPAMPLF